MVERSVQGGPARSMDRRHRGPLLVVGQAALTFSVMFAAVTMMVDIADGLLGWPHSWEFRYLMSVALTGVALAMRRAREQPARDER